MQEFNTHWCSSVGQFPAHRSRDETTSVCARDLNLILPTSIIFFTGCYYTLANKTLNCNRGNKLSLLKNILNKKSTSWYVTELTKNVKKIKSRSSETTPLPLPPKTKYPPIPTHLSSYHPNPTEFSRTFLKGCSKARIDEARENKDGGGRSRGERGENGNSTAGWDCTSSVGCEVDESSKGWVNLRFVDEVK